MGSSRKHGLLIAALLLIVAVLGAFAVRTAEYLPENPLSATAKTPLGMNALFLLLRAKGAEVDFFGQALELLPPGATLVVGDDAPFKPIASAHELRDYWKAVRERGHTVIYLPPVSGKNFSASPQGAEAKGALPPAAVEAKKPSAPQEPLPKLPASARAYEIEWEIDCKGYIHISADGLPGAAFAGVRELTGGGLSPYDIKPLEANSELAKGAQEVYFFKGTSRPFLVTASVGKGTWVEVSASELFTNRDIGATDNAVFAYNLLSQRQGSGIWFLESIHGYAESGVGAVALLFFSWWGQLIMLAAFCILLFFLKEMFPLGKDIDILLIAFPSTLERVRAQAELWRHGKHSYSALRFGLAHALGLGGDDAPKQLASWLKEDGHSPATASQLAAEMFASSGNRISPEALRAYGRLMRQHSIFRRYL